MTAWNAYVDPYGSWVDDPRYGRVWIPSPNVVGADFAPYSTGGHWALDENNDWVWVSDYPFGWVTFHYGRWVWIAGRGWAWIPGMRYAPAWVVWRTPVGSYDYVGWAPYPPSYVWFGVGVGFGAYWGAYPYYYAPVYPWVFCPSAYVYSPHVHAYIVHDHAEVAYAARNTRAYNVSPPHPVGAPGSAAAGVPRSPMPPHGPTPQAAHIPPRAMPVDRVSSRSIAARGSASIAMSSARPTIGARASTFTHSRAIPMDQRAAVGRGFPADRSGMAPRADTRLQPDFRTQPSMRPATAPLWNRQSVVSPRPGGYAPQYTPHQAPGQMSAPHFDPGRMRSAPAPAFHPSGGGFHPSGGGFHPSGGGSFHGGGGGHHH
jgi:hypothetical protein